MINEYHGATVNLYIDGQGYGATCLDVSCENTSDTQHLCPYAIGYNMPMEAGDRCYSKDGCECRRLAAQLAALKKAKALLAARIKEVENQIEEAE